MINFLCKLLSLNIDVVNKIENKSDIIFLLFSYMLIMSLSLYGFYSFSFQVLQNEFISLITTLFLMYVLNNMYRLIFSTSFSWNLLNNYKSLFFYLTRKGFLILILSLLASSSVYVMFFNFQIESDLENYKKNVISDYNEVLDINNQREIDDIISRYRENTEYRKLIGEDINPVDSLIMLKKINEIESKKLMMIQNLKLTISKSSFFITRVNISMSKFTYWLFNLLIMSLFLYPLYLFNTSDLFTKYQSIIKKQSDEIIINEYNLYKDDYQKAFLKFNLDIKLEERFTDPPFNKIPIDDTNVYFKKGYLLKWLNNYYGK